MSRLPQETLKDIGRYADRAPRYFVLAYAYEHSREVVIPLQTTAASAVPGGRFFLHVKYSRLTLSCDDNPRVPGVHRPSPGLWKSVLSLRPFRGNLLSLLAKILLTYTVDIDEFFLAGPGPLGV